MAAQGNLTLNTKVYNPRGKTGEIAKWQLLNDSTFGGASSAVTTTVRGPSRDGMYRARVKLDVPKAAESDSACGCAGTQISLGVCDIQIAIPANFTSAERDDFRLRIQGLVANAIFTSLVKDLEGSW